MKYVFLGNMNNMSYLFAREMRKCGYDVTLFIDVPASYKLDRPEAMDPDLDCKYPNWIIELKDTDRITNQTKLALFPLLKNRYLRIVNSYDVIILNGLWIRLGKYISKEKKVLSLFAGYDLDVLASFDKVNYHTNCTIKKYPLFFLLRPIIYHILKSIVKQQRSGIRRADAVNYYPSGINPISDNLLKQIKHGQKYKRLELRGFPFDNIYEESFKNGGKFTILNFTRFFYTDFSRNDNKRNDIMIHGIAEFIHDNKIKPEELQILFFEKGPDTINAKKLCEQLNISTYITWKKEISQHGLNSLIKECDVAFDQLGDQWIGYGIVVMAMGRPVIANGRPEVFEPLTGEPSPVCQATNSKEVSNWLKLLFYHPDKKQKIGNASSIYIRKHYDINKTINFITSI